MAAPRGENAGLRAIILYKTAKAAVQLAAALLLIVLWPFGLPDAIRHLSLMLRQHVTHGWALRLAAALAHGSSNHGIVLGIAALGFDGALTALEAWSLRTGRWWGAWLVVVATGSLLPFELYELARHPRVSRALLIVVNLIIVIYLARRARREASERNREAAHAGDVPAVTSPPAASSGRDGPPLP
jgi:uncharacterized membrane protein (DUF2068 family)